MRSAAAVPMLATATLVWLAPPWALPAGLRTDLQAGADPLPAVLHLCALGAWLAVGWLAVAAASAAAARLPGAAGRCAGALAARITPAVLRRAVGGGAAVGIALAPTLAPSVASAAGCLPGLDRATVACAPSTVSRSPEARTNRAAAASATAEAATVTVRAGDSLWSIAAAELRAGGRPASPAAIAARWPAWWAVNRAVVGAEPDLIHPGNVLSVPPRSEAPR